MPLSKERILYLLDAYATNTASEQEEEELFTWVNESGQHEPLQQFIAGLTNSGLQTDALDKVNWERIYQEIMQQASSAGKQAARQRILQYGWTAAAAILILVIAGVFFVRRSSTRHELVVTSNRTHTGTRNVAPPGDNKAVLTLADGTVIKLDSTGNGMLATQGNVQVVKKADGHISYEGKGSGDLYNTLTVPRGSKLVTIELSDGTLVWLNSESSLRYPASFKGKERKVEMTGEAYFEVAHNASMPFIVKKDAVEIKVLGTHFNMNMYDDEGMSKITLLEGSVSISTGDYHKFLKPGQQARITQDISLENSVDLDEVMAWKNGIFHFGNKTDLHLIMKMIARWYDVDVAYEKGPINQRFGGELPMNSNLSQVLEILRTSGVKFTIDGRKVTVQPRH